MFCVFSGQGVVGLRNHLNSLEHRGYAALDNSDDDDQTMTGMSAMGPTVNLLNPAAMAMNGLEDDDDADGDEELEDGDVGGGVTFNQD